MVSINQCQSLPSPGHLSMDFFNGLRMDFHEHDCVFKSIKFPKWPSSFPILRPRFHLKLWNCFSSHFGLPLNIVYDRDSCFLNTFWKTLWHFMGYRISFYSAFHPKKMAKLRWLITFSFILSGCIMKTQTMGDLIACSTILLKSYC